MAADYGWRLIRRPRTCSGGGYEHSRIYRGSSFYRTSGQCQIARQLINSSRDLTSSIYPARLKNEDEGVNCDTCVGGQCAELHCLETSALGDGGILIPVVGAAVAAAAECLPRFPHLQRVYPDGAEHLWTWSPVLHLH